MREKLSFGLFLIIAALVILPAAVSALDNVTAYGGTMDVYNVTSGNQLLQIRTNIPLTVEDIAYPDWLFEIMIAIGLVFLVSSLWFIARPTDVPSIAITMSGIIAFGCYSACALMAPYVAHIDATRDIIFNTDGTYIIAVTQSVTYLLSYWVGYACWGFALAGGVITIAGALSWAGYLHKKGLGDAAAGDYIESDMVGRGDPSTLEYKRVGNGRPKR